MLYSWLLILAEESTQQQQGPAWVGFLPLVLIAVFFYLILIAPMKRQEKQRQALVANLKKNDKIVNSGGIIGIVESVKEKENEVVLRGGLRITKASIVQVVSEEAPKEQKEGAS